VAKVGPTSVTVTRLAGAAGSGQVSLTADDDGSVHAVWSAQTPEGRRIMYRKFYPARENGKGSAAQPVDAVDARFDQLYPSVAVSGGHVTVAWEDRREGHTRIRVARSKKTGFAASQALNELPPPRSSVYGKGTGASRVALAALNGGGVVAVWADKRDFLSGYDVYAAVIDRNGAIGPNEQVQDEFGAAISQWHPAISGGAQAVAAWDDNRDETPDILLSWRAGESWSEDLSLPGGSGPGSQSDPSLAVDRHGNLHIAWVYRDRDGGPTGIRYLEARPFKAR
jgi:hypothetical protein